MTTTSYGFAGSLGAADYAQMARYIGSYGVKSTSDWQVSAVSGQRAVSLAAGEIYGWNVRAVSTAAQTVNLPTPSAGQWFLIVATRDWGAKTTTPNYVAGATTSTTTPTVAPSSLPAINSTPGTLDDQPLAWAWVNNTSTVVTIFDLRPTPLDQRVGTAEGNIAALTAAFTTAVDVSGTDLNSITKSGWYSGNNLTHSPDGTTVYFAVQSLYRNTSLAAQTATRIADGATFRRVLTGAGWQPWQLTGADTGWSLTPISLASGWSTVTDPNGITGTGAIGGARIVGKTLELRFRCKRTGAALSAGSDGNLPDTNLGTVAAGFIPASVIYDVFTNGNYSGIVRLGTDGVMQVTGQYPSDSIATNDVIQVQARGFID